MSYQPLRNGSTSAPAAYSGLDLTSARALSRSSTSSTPSDDPPNRGFTISGAPSAPSAGSSAAARSSLGIALTPARSATAANASLSIPSAAPAWLGPV